MIRKGICKNIGLCNNANTHKVIIITDDDAPFECECGEPLEEYKEDEPVAKNNGNNKKLFGILAAAVLVIVIAVLAIVFGGGSSSDDEGVVIQTDTIAQTEPEPESVATDTVFIQVTDTIRDTVTVENNITTIIETPQT